jgi:hypothetical protein
MHSVPKDHSFAERQPGLRTIPIYEFVDRVPVPALSIGTGKAVEDSGLRDFEVRQPQHGFGGPSFGVTLRFLLHHPWPPSPRVDHVPSDINLGPVWASTDRNLGSIAMDHQALLRHLVYWPP